MTLRLVSIAISESFGRGIHANGSYGPASEVWKFLSAVNFDFGLSGVASAMIFSTTGAPFGTGKEDSDRLRAEKAPPVKL
ncbi:hypothetical protein ARMGADRAFT_1076107 [Armillaria gallica]|uniref:Uncharacterized protein n=1 Tax=Armillaria gallica TaxID=47427 RepID=A0A2H3E3C3_ARMGA|nr:hypothetical protein ARMGADRAFT_1076107 [Armillaria gallica]